MTASEEGSSTRTWRPIVLRWVRYRSVSSSSEHTSRSWSELSIARSTSIGESGCPTIVASDVAPAGAQLMLTPVPMITDPSAVIVDSIPASFVYSPRGLVSGSITMTSFGHFNDTLPTSKCRVAAMTASATACCRCCGWAMGGRNSIEHSKFSPAGASHRRSRRPRPAVCTSATSTVRSGRSLVSSRRTSSSFVLPIESRRVTCQPSI